MPALARFRTHRPSTVDPVALAQEGSATSWRRSLIGCTSAEPGGEGRRFLLSGAPAGVWQCPAAAKAGPGL